MTAPRKRLLQTALKLIVGLTLLALIAGAGYEELGRRRDRRLLPPIGQAVDIGGRALHLNCGGTGSPTVILASGAATPGYTWLPIQSELAQSIHTCWYDRAGEGWSDPGPYPPTSGADARDLHTLLHGAAVPPPYLLVGHSLGGLDVRIFAGLYPDEVAGVVLVESAHEDEPRRAPAAYLGPRPPRYAWFPLHLLFRLCARVGLIRALSPPITLAQPADRTVDQVVAALRRQPQAVASYSSRGVVSPDSYAEAHAAAGLGDRPLIVLTRGRPAPHPPLTPEEEESAAYEEVWMHELQPQLARLSTRGRQVIVASSGHRIPDEAPGAVIDAVREVLSQVRRMRRVGP
jgi:pimeloyl-ACP methyl ester carboxylesterase